MRVFHLLQMFASLALSVALPNIIRSYKTDENCNFGELVALPSIACEDIVGAVWKCDPRGSYYEAMSSCISSSMVTLTTDSTSASVTENPSCPVTRNCPYDASVTAVERSTADEVTITELMAMTSNMHSDMAPKSFFKREPTLDAPFPEPKSARQGKHLENDKPFKEAEMKFKCTEGQLRCSFDASSILECVGKKYVEVESCGAPGRCYRDPETHCNMPNSEYLTHRPQHLPVLDDGDGLEFY
ncbi:hypothetical protein CC78DRAFT_540384 [Lojkania enalia]|uniref:Uncharacterized protein n=1 Tax=Lojkania enalia TaxID=147567 RepID=A0A9P4KIV1_9PLEO|nr:hypothetical protein CC78DRAFT_540384 [Didymosphaeria enalia]